MKLEKQNNIRCLKAISEREEMALFVKQACSVDEKVATMQIKVADVRT